MVTWPDSFVHAYRNQSHYRKVPQREIFMEDELRFGLYATFEASFFKFSWSKINKEIVASALKVS